uniref:Uncharacterized protein n=1 Tax=Ectopseudomonas oleovorans TaxID=301 RepID=A0A653BCZ4_ECTOL
MAYLVFMLLGAGSVFLIARQPVSNIIAALTLVLLVAGYGSATSACQDEPPYLETILLSVTAFLLMLPTLSEVLRACRTATSGDRPAFTAADRHAARPAAGAGHRRNGAGAAPAPPRLAV